MIEFADSLGSSRRSNPVAIHLHLSQEAFRHVLAMERVRARRSCRGLMVVFLKAKVAPNGIGRIERRLGEGLLAALGRCLRESDHVGWYLEERVVGAILTDPNESVPERVADLERRVVDSLDDELGGSLRSRVHVRIRQLRPGLEG